MANLPSSQQSRPASFRRTLIVFSQLSLIWRIARTSSLILFLMGFLGQTGLVSAGEVFIVGAIEIDTPWARATIVKTRPAAAYFTIRNKGLKPDRLMAVESPVAAMTHIHQTKKLNGAMTMLPVGPIEISPGQAVTLKPGGLHVMMMKLETAFKEGENTELELTFERAGKITVLVPIFGPGAREPK